MSDRASVTKAEIRSHIRAIARGIGALERERLSRQVCERMALQPVWQQAQSILFYAPLPLEVDIWPLLLRAHEARKLVCLPRYDSIARVYDACHVTDPELDISMGFSAIREPGPTCRVISLMQLDLVLVPGVAFDGEGRRLGRGRGDYDRLLARVRGTKCGVAFDYQIQFQLPEEPHDIRLDCILTPTRWLVAGRGTVRK